jgi:hypothetical protein
MGWNIDISLGKPIHVTVLEKVLTKLPKNLCGFNSKQQWGWSMAVDVMKPATAQTTVIKLSGAGFSSPVAREFSAHLSLLLSERGYKPKVGKMQW